MQVQRTGKTAMHFLCGNPPTAAAARQHAETVNMLPQTLPANVLNGHEAETGTPLMLSLASRNTALVQWLLLHGTDLNAVSTPIARCPIMVAVRLKDAQYLEQLLSFGANVHCHDAIGRTPLSCTLDIVILSICGC